MNTPQAKAPIASKVPTTAQGMCPQCGRRALVKGRYDGPDGDSRAWAYCNRCPYNYED